MEDQSFRTVNLGELEDDRAKVVERPAGQGDKVTGKTEFYNLGTGAHPFHPAICAGIANRGPEYDGLAVAPSRLLRFFGVEGEGLVCPPARSAPPGPRPPAHRTPPGLRKPQALCPFHLHAAIRTAVHDDDHREDRWTPSEWHQAATRALSALGSQWASTTHLGPSRMLLIGCLRQGLRLARSHRLTDLGWLTDAAFAYTSDSIWEPLAPPAPGGEQGLETPADAVAELLTAIGRRQREHRERAVDRLTAVLDSGLLPTALTEMALYYRAKANKDLDRTDAARAGMQQVADIGGRFTLPGRQGLANLARLGGGFPTALAAVPTLGWEGRHHPVLGDIHWPHANFGEAIAAFENAKTAAALRAAMTRLFEGRPQRTDGRLTKENLYKEAQVSRATMNRAHAILAEWDAHIAAHGKATPGEAKRDATIADLKKRLTTKTQECTLLENKLKAARTAIAALFHDNEALRQQLDRDVSTTVTPIRTRGPRHRR
ncbi:hypothetical protein ACWGLE_22080 [Streptomyces sp. NPDC055897]